jgi:hypothetical protein
MDESQRRRAVDEVIGRANAKAARLLAEMDLTEAEREAATEHGMRLVREATRTMEGPTGLGERVIPASFAFALCWLEDAYQLTRPPPPPPTARTAKRRRKRGE